ncbi:MAG: nuclear transport factor 2 family protein [Acidimicrobiia bacterium]|nr:nuclear transport factor 2 family protein [Acidimicrobiia bacterium]
MEPAERIEGYFAACSDGSEADIAAHFTDDAVIFDSNIRPVRGSAAIGAMWVKVRRRWQGARWTVDSFVGDGDGAAIEWSMTGTDPDGDRPFVFRGSEHYSFETAGEDELLIAEIRQYWTFDLDKLDTGLVDYPYSAGGEAD